MPMKKTDIGFLVNTLELGKFDCKQIVEQQDKIANAIGDSNNVRLTPKIYKQAIACANRHKWLKAIDNELCNMRRHNVFDILPLPQNTKPIGGRWVFALKPAHFKARYVARGNSQLSGFDFHNTFAPTATFPFLLILLTLAAQLGLHISTFDFVAAYLNASIDEEIWIRPPEGLMVPTGSGCRLCKALYGTKQAGRCWWSHLSIYLKKGGFHVSNYDPSVYLNNDCGMIIWLHVDDSVVFAK
ncbi:hypothetical protein O181_028513 [Austropuccinia psidii MF-1]|uniref:Reverse transcriptase Ty1/copia-type domain-containing protein n=1 Tax=Austropuccinia psidii MF-1 TaxID=1389203 RepID=A0A9Q3H1W6_9BASI|nr:hypothetical protein [Austropuccinia psidii MF-1]